MARQYNANDRLASKSVWAMYWVTHIRGGRAQLNRIRRGFESRCQWCERIRTFFVTKQILTFDMWRQQQMFISSNELRAFEVKHNSNRCQHTIGTYASHQSNNRASGAIFLSPWSRKTFQDAINETATAYEYASDSYSHTHAHTQTHSHAATHPVDWLIYSVPAMGLLCFWQKLCLLYESQVATSKSALAAVTIPLKRDFLVKCVGRDPRSNQRLLLLLCFRFDWWNYDAGGGPYAKWNSFWARRTTNNKNNIFRLYVFVRKHRIVYTVVSINADSWWGFAKMKIFSLNSLPPSGRLDNFLMFNGLSHLMYDHMSSSRLLCALSHSKSEWELAVSIKWYRSFHQD